MLGFLPHDARGKVVVNSRAIMRKVRNRGDMALVARLIKRKTIPYWTGAIILLASLFVISPAEAAEQSFARDIPSFLFIDNRNVERDLGEFRGRPVLLTLWATWCGYCVREMPQLDRLAGRVKDNRLAVIAISVDREPLIAAQSFYRMHEIKRLAIYGDQTGAIMSVLDVIGLPFSILVDSQGREIERFTGSVDWDSSVMRDYLSGKTGQKLF